ncbi:MAG: hypothetical protein V1793_02470 [Pseudomonadota bacterium]
MIKNLRPRLSEAGKIKIGIKGQQRTSSQGKDFRPPEKLDHFIIVTTERDKDGNYIPDITLMTLLKSDKALVNSNGDLVNIPIRLLYDNPMSNMETQYVSYNGGVKSCYGDGEVSFKKLKGNFTIPCTCPCERLDPGYGGKDKCKASGKLVVMVDGANLFGQVHVFRTTGINSIEGLIGGMNLIITTTNGRLSGLPLMLTINAKSTVTPDGVPTTVYVVGICYRGGVESLQEKVYEIAAREHQYHIGMRNLKALPITGSEVQGLSPLGVEPDSAEEQDFIDEFFPEARSGVSSTAMEKKMTVAAEPTTTVDAGAEVVGAEITDNDNDVPPGDNVQQEDQAPDNTPVDPGAEVTNPAPEVKESTKSYMGEFPVGPYKKVYESFLVETDVEKAMNFLRRLRKENLQYWLSTEHPKVQFPEKALKPALLEICEGILKEKLCAGGADSECVSITDVIISTMKSMKAPEELAKHKLMIAIATAKDQKGVADACTEYFRPNPIDRTQPIEGLVKMSVAYLIKQHTVLSQTAETVQKNQEVVSAHTTPADSGNTAEPVNMVNQAEQNLSTKYPREFNESKGLIIRDQKLTIAKLRKILEDDGIIEPGSWEKNVAYFLDAEGKPLQSAKDMTFVQAETFIKVLEDHVDIPF